MRTELIDFAVRALGGCDVVGDRSWGHGGSSVLQVRDRAGETWYVKGHRRQQHYRRERIAYERWTPTLGRSAARLRAYNDDVQALLLSGLPGEVALQSGMDSAVQRRAGKRRYYEPVPRSRCCSSSFGPTSTAKCHLRRIAGPTCIG